MRKFISFLLCLMLLITTFSIFAQAANEVLYGDYVVIVNTNPDTTAKESTGNIVFDSSNSGSTQFDTPQQAIASDLPLVPDTTGTAGGVSRTYAVGNTITERGMTYTCIAVGEKCYVWMERSLKSGYDSAGKTSQVAQDIMRAYEGKPYDVLNTLANGQIRYLDNSGKLSIMLENDPQSTAAGYYAMETNITAIHISCPLPSSYLGGDFESRNGLFAHEGQHALFHLLSAGGNSINGYRWFNEGLAVAAMEWVWGQQPTSQWLSYLAGSSDVRKGSAMIYNDYRNKTALDYSLPYLYVRYIANRYSGKYAPLMFMQNVYKVNIFKSNGTQKTAEEFLNDVFAYTGMKNSDGTTLTFRQSLVDFYVAAVKQDRSGIYSFYGDTTVKNSVGDYPIYMGTSGSAVSLDGTAAIVVKTLGGRFTVPANHGTDIRYIAFNKTQEPFRPSNGNGTAANPYVVSTAQELVTTIDQYPSASVSVANDIDLSGIAYSSVTDFSGILDGQGHTLSGVSRALVHKNTGTIKNINIIGSANDEYFSATGLVANQNEGYILDCTVSGTMSPRVIGASIRYVPIWGTIVAENSAVGTVERCGSTANINLTIDANVIVDTVAGGIVGKNSGTVTDCYSAGRLAVTRVGNSNKPYYVGGIAGLAKGGISNPFYRCYSVAEVINNGSAGSVTVAIGRFAGSFGGYVYTENCFSLSEMDAIGYRASNAMSVTEKSSSELKTQSTYTYWNFNGVWKMPNGGYPVIAPQSDVRTVEALGSTYVFAGERLDYTALRRVRLSVNGDSFNSVALSEDMIDMTTFNSSRVGTQTVSGLYRGCPFTFDVTVSAPKSTADLTVYMPGKTDYVVGAKYDSSEVVLRVKINGATYATTIYSGFTHNKPNPLTQTDTSVTYTYYSSSVSQAITVNEFSVSGINIVSTPDKTSYATGETLDFNNLGVRVQYNDSTSTATLEYADLNSRGVSLVQRLTNGIWKRIDTETALTIADNDSTLYLYYGDTMPSDYNEVIRSKVADITVQERLSMADQVISIPLGVPWHYENTDYLKGSGNVNIRLVSGTLPPNVSVSLPRVAGNDYNCFYFNSNGTGVTGAAKDYPLVYEVESQSTGQKIYVNITIRVRNKSNVAEFDYVRFAAANNSTKLQEDVYGVIDSENGTVTLTLPHGTSGTLFMEYKTLEGGTAMERNGNWLFNGDYDIERESTIECYIESETGVRKYYTIYFVVAPEEKIELVAIEGSGAVVDNDNKTVFGIAPGLETLSGYVTVSGAGCEINVKKQQNKIGTGTAVEIRKNGTTLDTYTVVIFGDVNGDGWYDGTDAVLVNCIVNGLLTVESLGNASFTAADCNHDGEIDVLDVQLLQQAGVLLGEVNQNSSAYELFTSSAYIEYVELIEQASESTPQTEPAEQAPQKEPELVVQTIRNIIERFLGFIKMLSNIFVK